MQNQYIIYGAVGVLLFILVIFLSTKNKNNNSSSENIIESYFYRYGGDLNWIKSKLESHKYKSLDSMLVCRNSEESNFRIDILEGENTISMNVYAAEFSYGKSSKLKLILTKLPLNNKQYEFFLANARLKPTYLISAENNVFGD